MENVTDRDKTDGDPTDGTIRNEEVAGDGYTKEKES